MAGAVRKELTNADLRVNPEGVRSVLEDLEGLLARAEFAGFPQVLLKGESWAIGDPVAIRLFERLMDHGRRLGEFVSGRIYRGVTTGLNDAFVIDAPKRNELIEDDLRSAEIIKPWLRGRDVKRWKAEPHGLFVIFANRGIDIDMYPAVKEHLSWFRGRLEERATAHLHPWYELQQPQEGIYHEFVHPKVIFNRFVMSPTFAYDVTGSYHNDACYFAVPPSPAFAAIVNSSVAWWILCRLCTMLQNGYYQIFVQFLEQLPIPELSSETDQLLSAHVETLASGIEDSSIEAEIDTLVFESFGLSATERKLVLDNLGERREALGAEMPPDWRKLNALRATAGAWKDSIDGDKLIEDIYASRLIDTRPEPRL